MFAVVGIGISNLVSIDILNATVDQIQAFEGIDIYEWIGVLLVSILGLIAIFNPEVYQSVPRWISSTVASLKAMVSAIGKEDSTGDATLDEIIQAAGYSYDIKQDIFYSNMNAWQRYMGYCRLYDEAAAPLGMIIDCEPIYFSYNGRRWMIEFWKGQYDLSAGCEIGVYITEEPDLNIPGIFEGPFFQCASDVDLLHMSYSLKKNGEILFTREDKHWWLTGFKLGEFVEPSELTMDLTITLKDEDMLNEFVKGLRNAGYSKNEITISGNTVALRFDKTRTPQPTTRTPETDWIIQRKNKFLCDKYQAIADPYESLPDKLNAVLEQAPELYEEIMKIGKTKQLFGKYEKLRKYLR